MSAISDIDLTNADLFVSGDPHVEWARLRREAPVYWNRTADGRFWALTTYEDVVAAYRDHTTFSSAYGAMLGGSYRRQIDTASGRMLVASDPPQHPLLRRRMQRVFSASMLDRVLREVRSRVESGLERLATDGGGDFATDVALELPTGALMAMFAIGQREAVRLLELTRGMIGYRDPDHHAGVADDATRLAVAQAEIFDFFSELVAERRANPGDDAVSALLGADLDERPLDEEALLFNLMNLAVGGNETTPHSASGGMLALIDKPDQWDRLRRDPGLVGTAVDETLRWTSTNAYVQRVVTRPVRIRDVALAEGDVVTLWNASANRDETKFVDADRFDVGRRPNHHLAFGSGLHHCIGATTARPELAALFEALSRVKWRFILNGPPRRLRSNFMLGIKSLPVRIVTREQGGSACAFVRHRSVEENDDED